MSSSSAASYSPDTISILIATDNHVGYNERDAIRGNDSWKTFHEIMCLAKERDVDMVLLAGDLFHENKPSRKSMYNVMRSLRMNCLGDKPCALELLSDPTENFTGAFDHANYEDPDINISIPVFSIHGNHDDPSGDDHLAALDILQTAGLVNYYGRTPESDNIHIKPLLLQKGRTKLALYGMSNVRDERLFRTFREGRVKFFQPNTQRDNWFNLMSVHQNHHAYTETGFLPENFLPNFIDFVVWGHEHECIISPKYNTEMGFYVMQPGSSVATSLMPGEAVPKQVAILKVTGKNYQYEPIRLKTVRPFVMKEITLQNEPALKKIATKDNNRPEITRHLMGIVEELIEEAKTSWLEAQSQTQTEEETDIPLPLIRLRVDYTAPEGGHFDCENPQRFSNRFVNKVANVNDVIQFHRKKAAAARGPKKDADMPEESVLAQMSIDTVKVDKLVREYLTAQSLTILPQNNFGDAVTQFVDKDDKHAVEIFVGTALSEQINHLLKAKGNDDDDDDDEDIARAMGKYRSTLEAQWASGHYKAARRARIKPKPAHWDSDLDGEWADQPGALIISEDEHDHNQNGEADEEQSRQATPARSNTVQRGSSTRARGKAAAATRGGTSTRASQRGTKAANRGRGTRQSRAAQASEEDDDDDVVMLNDDDVEDPSSNRQSTRARSTRQVSTARAQDSTAATATATRKATATSRTTSSRSTGRQAQLTFSQASTPAPTTNGSIRPQPRRELSDDEISDESDAFEPTTSAPRTRSKR